MVNRYWTGPIAAILTLALGNLLIWRSNTVTASPLPLSAQETAVPLAAGGWQGNAMDVDPRAIEILQTPDVLLREYQKDGKPAVWLARVAGFGQRAAFHPPELCYVGSHFEVLERGPVDVYVHGKVYRLMRLVIGREGERKELVEAWYWFTASGRATSNYYQQQIWLLWDALRGKSQPGTLVRISTLQDSPQASYNRLQAFLDAFTSSLLLP